MISFVAHEPRIFSSPLASFPESPAHFFARTMLSSQRFEKASYEDFFLSAPQRRTERYQHAYSFRVASLPNQSSTLSCVDDPMIPP
mmetsp:Transcript_24535/g.51419  ORF Transcript_24535/g.51419 Transcript_24535/m.51419 type:complete len:86 (-) Transcript_24535:852-1109(-)